jgi:hypothetical protein
VVYESTITFTFWECIICLLLNQRLPLSHLIITSILKQALPHAFFKWSPQDSERLTDMLRVTLLVSGNDGFRIQDALCASTISLYFQTWFLTVGTPKLSFPVIVPLFSVQIQGKRSKQLYPCYGPQGSLVGKKDSMTGNSSQGKGTLPDFS